MNIALCKSCFAGAISGADETLVTYAVKLREAGHAVRVVLIFPSPPDNPYAERLRAAGVSILVVAERALLFRLIQAARALLAHFLFFFFFVSNFPNQMRRIWQVLLTSLARLHYADCCAFFETHRFDVVHLLTPDTGTTVMIRAGHAAGARVLYHELGTPQHMPELQVYYDRLSQVTPLCASVVALSPALARQWAQRLPHAHEIGVLPLIVMPPTLKSFPRRPIPYEVIYGFAARMEEGKGALIMIEAFARFREGFAGAYLRLAGRGPHIYRMRSHVKRRGVDEACDFVGTYTEEEGRVAFMQSLDVFVLPTLAEGTPNSVIEAMAAGLPVIASAVGGLPEIITPEIGILVPPGDACALAEAMLRLARDAELRRRMGRAARARYLEMFSPEAVLPILLRTYERVAARASCAPEAAGAERDDYTWGLVAQE
jgi:glycosyltransferase involved in cell wall biosynthesis